VCQGYSSLLVELARRLGLRAEIVTGMGKGAFASESSLDSLGHAWTAIECENRWTLHDVTWGSGIIKNDAFVRDCKTHYFDVPPQWLIHTHFPNDYRWQLLTSPVSRGEYDLLQRLQPDYFSSGIEILADLNRPLHIAASGELRFERKQPKWLMADFHPSSGGVVELDVDHLATRGTVRWSGLPSGTGRIGIFVGGDEYGQFKGVARLNVYVG
jgi:hypothetical protein